MDPETQTNEKKEPAAPVSERIDYDAFIKIDMRIGTIVEAEAIPDAKNLLKLTVDIGSEMRQIVAGIAQVYVPAELIGRQIAIVANLKPRKLRGVESDGMLLAVGETAADVVLLTTERKVDNGLQVR